MATSSSSKFKTMITIESSWGTITTDDNGIVIEKDLLENDGKERCYLLDAERFDLEEWCNWYEKHTDEEPFVKPIHFDILELGFWNKDGKYVPAHPTWRDEMYFKS
jgi:hypothetical protein